MRTVASVVFIFFLVVASVGFMTRVEVVRDAHADITNELVGYWKFDEGTGITAYDSSGSGNDGTLMNGPTWVDGKIDEALYFDGDDGYVRVEDSTSISSPSVTRAITVVAWVKPDAGLLLDRYARVVASHWFDGEGTSADCAWVLEAHEDGRYHAIIAAGDGVNYIDLPSGTPVQEGGWQHLAFTWDGSTVTFYFNGNVDATTTYTLTLSDSSRPMQIGKTDTFYYVWKGIIDEVRLYNRALSADEIRALMAPTTTHYVRTYVPNEWIGGGTPMGWHADDDSWQYELPFDFPFYGTSYRTIYISSNGLITFTGPDSSYGNSIDALFGRLAIAPAWDDWVTYSPYEIYIWQPDSSHVIIRWEAQAYGSSTVANFEAVLGLDGVIQFNYGYNDGPISATAGISNGVDDILAEDLTNLNYINTIVFTPYGQPELDILVYTDDGYVEPALRYVIVALNDLGKNYTHYPDDPTGFVAALTTQHWDMVIADHDNYYEFGNNWVELENYVIGGGRLALSTFDIDGSHSEPTSLWATLGVQWTADMPYPEPIYRWEPAHPIFNVPNAIGDLTYYEEDYIDDGDHVSATTGTALAGFTISPTTEYAGIVTDNGGRTVLMSFLSCEFRSDEDSDGKLDAVELWENVITWLAPPITPQHDVAVIDIEPNKVIVGQGYEADVNVTVANYGSYQGTFNVSLFAEPAGLVGCWRFDEGTGTMAYDSSGNNNTGTLFNGPQWIDGRLDKALSFDGVDDYVKVPYSDVLNISNAITISTWFKIHSVTMPGPDFGGDMGFISKDYAYMLGYQSFDDGTSNASAWLLFAGEPWTRLIGPRLNIDTWYHETVTFDGSTTRLYLNGVEVANLTHTGTIYTSSNNFPLGFGNRFVLWNPYSASFFNGTIDEAKVYNRALSADEVWAEYSVAPTLIQTQSITLESGESTNLTFTWDTTGWPTGYYILRAVADTVSGETDIADNTFINTTSIYVGIAGDVNGDHFVGIDDIYNIALRYGTEPGGPPNPRDYYYSPMHDINNDDFVGIDDIFIAASHFGQEDP